MNSVALNGTRPARMMRGLGSLTKLWAVIGGIGLLLIVAVTSINAVLFIFDRIAGLTGGDVRGLPGYEDFVMLCVSGAALSYFPYGQLVGSHIFVTIFTMRLPGVVNKTFDRGWNVLIAAAALFLCFWMVQGMFERRSDMAVSRVLEWPEWPFFLPGIVSLLLWAAVAALQALFPAHAALYIASQTEGDVAHG